MTARPLAARLATPNPHRLPAVEVFHIKGSPPPWVMGLFDQRVPLRVTDQRDRWHRTDLILQRQGLSATMERLGARMGAVLCVLPEQEHYVRTFIAARQHAGLDTALFVAYPGCELTA